MYDNTHFRFGLIGLLCLLLISPGWKQLDLSNRGSTSDVLTTISDSLLNAPDIVGFSISIGQGDSILFQSGYGMADKDKNIKVQRYHKFRVYSLSKFITAVGAAKLAEDGQFLPICE